MASVHALHLPSVTVRVFEYQQVWSASRRFLDSIELRGTVEIVSRHGQSREAEVQEARIVSEGLRMEVLKTEDLG